LDWSGIEQLAVKVVEAAVVLKVSKLLLMLLRLLDLLRKLRLADIESRLDQCRSEGSSAFIGLSNLEQLVLENIELLLLGKTKGFSLLFCLLLVDKSSLGNLVLGAGLVLVVKAIAEGGCDLLPGDRLAASSVSVLVVSDKGRRVSFLEAGLFDKEVDVGDNGGLDHLGSGVDVFVYLGLDKCSKFAVSRGLLGDTSFSNNDCAFSWHDSRRGFGSSSRGNSGRLELLR